MIFLSNLILIWMAHTLPAQDIEYNVILDQVEWKTIFLQFNHDGQLLQSQNFNKRIQPLEWKVGPNSQIVTHHYDADGKRTATSKAFLDTLGQHHFPAFSVYRYSGEKLKEEEVAGGKDTIIEVRHFLYGEEGKIERIEILLPTFDSTLNAINFSKPHITAYQFNWENDQKWEVSSNGQQSFRVYQDTDSLKLNAFYAGAPILDILIGFDALKRMSIIKMNDLNDQDYSLQQYTIHYSHTGLVDRIYQNYYYQGQRFTMGDKKDQSIWGTIQYLLNTRTLTPIAIKRINDTVISTLIKELAFYRYALRPDMIGR